MPNMAFPLSVKRATSAWHQLIGPPKHQLYPSCTKHSSSTRHQPSNQPSEPTPSLIHRNITYTLNTILEDNGGIDDTLACIYYNFFNDNEYWENIMLHAFIIFNRLNLERLKPSEKYKMIIMSFLITAKLLEDDHFTNGAWLPIFKTDIQYINRLELFFLIDTRFNLIVTQAQLDAIRHYIESSSTLT